MFERPCHSHSLGGRDIHGLRSSGRLSSCQQRSSIVMFMGDEKHKTRGTTNNKGVGFPHSCANPWIRTEHQPSTICAYICRIDLRPCSIQVAVLWHSLQLETLPLCARDTRTMLGRKRKGTKALYIVTHKEIFR